MSKRKTFSKKIRKNVRSVEISRFQNSFVYEKPKFANWTKFEPPRGLIHEISNNFTKKRFCDFPSKITD